MLGQSENALARFIDFYHLLRGVCLYSRSVHLRGESLERWSFIIDIYMEVDTNFNSLFIRIKQREVAIPIKASYWNHAERLRDDFKNSLSDTQYETLNEPELLLTFISHILSKEIIQEPSDGIVDILFSITKLLRQKYLSNQDPHCRMANILEGISLRDGLRIYYQALSVLIVKKNDLRDPDMFSNQSALLGESRVGRAKILCAFGGQGNTEELIEELAEIHYIYGCFCEEFIQTITVDLKILANDGDFSDYMNKGLDFVKWISEPSSRPPKEYLFSSAVSLPLVAIIQLSNYYINYKILGLSFATFRDHFVACTGHSQGIVSASVISLSSNEDEFIKNCKSALRLLFLIGVRAMKVYPIVSIDPNIQFDSSENSEGLPSPMLSITNLPLETLKKCLETTNNMLPEEEALHLSLLNGPRAFVCSGSPKSLYGLNVMLRSMKANSSMDQAKIPFSERKIRFSSKFLPISSPFHCLLLKQAVKLILKDVEERDVTLIGNKFHIDVINTENASIMTLSKSLIQELVELICIKPVDWKRAVGLKEMTHVFDFGPGHSSGIGALTFRNVEGTGVQVKQL